MDNNAFKASIVSYYDDELDQAIAEAIEQFGEHNIRCRTPNRNVGPKHQQKYFKEECKYR